MSSDDDGFDGRWYAHGPMRNALLAGLVAGGAFTLGHAGWIPQRIETLLYVLAIPLGGYHWMREALEALIMEREVKINLLMMAAAAGSAVLGMWDEAAFLVFLYGAAEGLEEYTYARTRASIRKLLDLAPKEARVDRDGEEKTVPAETLKPGDVFVVKPGESIPTDGVILNGRSSVNEAPVTGEAMPVEKAEGMKVFAATLNQEGALRVKATAAFQDNTLSKMVHLVEEAQTQKGKSQLFIEKFGKFYSPLVLLGALLLLMVPFVTGAPLADWARRAVVLLVAAAPCALVMSTPIAIAAGIGRAGRSGVLIKGGMHLENLGKIKVVAFDKTGTLTQGKPVVTDVFSLDGNRARVLALAAGVEQSSEHPLAKAVMEKAAREGVRPPAASNFAALVGAGAVATVGAAEVHVGKPDLFESLGADVSAAPNVAEFRGQGKTVVFVGENRKLVGLIAIRDNVRDQAKGALRELVQKGVYVAMLTGDNARTARAIAQELAVDEVRADLKPEDKIKAVEDLERRYGPVAMVGDGVNDAPALARATVGMAMGTAGTDAAVEAADVALMADDLSKVLYALNLGKKARRISLQNIVFSIGVLALLIPLALMGTMSVAMAVVFHEGSELLAVANGLRVVRED